MTETEPGRLREAAVEPGHPPHLSGEPDLAEGDDVGRERLVDDGRGDGADDGEVGGRLGDADAADGGREDVARPHRRTGPFVEDGDDHRETRRVETAEVRRGDGR